MLLDTDSVKADVLTTMNGSVAEQDTIGRPIDRYNGRYISESIRWENRVIRLFVLHNFSDGVMWVRYTWGGYDRDGFRHGMGRNAPSKWIIHKENGRWEIVKIIEAP
jgi:hypothetical protein